MSRRRILVGVAVLAVASGAATAVLLNRGHDVDAVVIVMDEARYPTATPSDWVTYADHVVVATVSEEAEGQHGEFSADSGFVDRAVTLDIDEVLWSRAQPSKPLPEAVTVDAVGWSYTGEDTAERTALAIEDSPRLEVDHTYIVALDWVPARCDVGDLPQPAGWHALGSDAIVPYDEGVIGQGELEGREQTVAQVQATQEPSDPNFSFEDAMLGKTAEDLRRALASASAGSRAAMDRDEAAYACESSNS